MSAQACGRRSAVVGAALTLLVAGCSTTVTGRPTSTSPSTPPASSEESTVSTPLADRPSSATVSATYDQMQADIRTAVTAAAPSVVWKLRHEPGAAGCDGDLAGQGGRTAFLQPWGAPGPISDEQWPAVVTAVNTAIASYEFGALSPIADQPADHLAEAVGPYGATVEIGTGKNVILSVITGCHPE